MSQPSEPIESQPFAFAVTNPSAIAVTLTDAGPIAFANPTTQSKPQSRPYPFTDPFTDPYTCPLC